MLAIANADASSEDDDDGSIDPSSSTKRGANSRSNSGLKERVAALRSRHAAEREGLSKRAGRIDLDDVSRRFSGATLAKPKVAQLGPQAPPAAAARPPPSSPVSLAAPLGPSGPAPSKSFQMPLSSGSVGEAERDDADSPPAASKHDPSVAALCTFMHVWKPSAGGADEATGAAKPA